MYHEAAKAIFCEIRNRPYAWSTTYGLPANNCYFKGTELLQRLGAIGYTVRGKVRETYLDEKIPTEIKNQYPSQFLLTHFWVEVFLENMWHTLDASYDPGLQRIGFIVNGWESNQTCFDITKVCTQEETVSYAVEWHSEEYAQRYFSAIYPCATSLNAWFEKLRTNT